MSVARICLFNPVDIPSYPPLNLTYLSAYLKKHGACQVDIRLVDINCSKDPLSDILAWEPDMVGFTSFSPKALDIYALAAALRQRNPHVVQVCGGVHATIAPEEVLSRGKFDVAVIGEGEQTFTDLVDVFAAAGNKLECNLLATVKGIAYRAPEGIRINSPRDLIADLDTIPHPDRDLLDNDFYSTRFFVQRGMNTSRVSTIAASRGCPFRCIYCCVNFTARNRLRYHSTEYVVDEMEQVVAKYGIRWLFFTDDTFLVDKQWTRRLCERIIDRGLVGKVKWEVQVRSNLANRKDLPLLMLMKQAGCEQIDYGFETGNQRVLTQIKGPGITIADHVQAIEVTHAAGIHVMGTFILGMPGETYAEMLDTRQFIYNHLDRLHRFQIFCMTPYPGTKLYDLCVAKGLAARDYCEEIEKERAIGCDHMSRVYADCVPAEKVLTLKNELDLISISLVGYREKIRWLLFNLRHKPHNALEGIRWLASKRKNIGKEGAWSCR